MATGRFNNIVLGTNLSGVNNGDGSITVNAAGGAPSGAAGGALDGTYPNPGIAASVAGAGLAETADVLSVNVDGSTIEINTDTLRVKDGGITEAKIGLADNTTDDVSTTKHGFAPKAPNDATKFLDGTGAYDTVKDADLSTSDITTNDVTTAKHGFVPKAPADAAKFLRGDGAWATVGSSGGGVVGNDAIWDAKGDLAAATGADAAVAVTVGANGTILTADSTQTAGVKWGPANGMVQLADSLLGADAASFDFTSISGAYSQLMLVLYLRTDRAVTTDGVSIRLNNLSTSIYYDQTASWAAAGANTPSESLAATSAAIGRCPANTATALRFGSINLWLPNYANATNHKSFVADAIVPHSTTSGTITRSVSGGVVEVTAAVSRVTVILPAGSNFRAGSRATLYGLA